MTRVIFQLCTVSWQKQGEFTTGSGILNESHHIALNGMDDVICATMYPSTIQTSDDPLVIPFNPTDMDPAVPKVPVAVVSPNSDYRFHDMAPEVFTNYVNNLTDAVMDAMDRVEEHLGQPITLCLAHHLFINAVILRDCIRRRVEQGKTAPTLSCFIHGTKTKMYVREMDPEETDFAPRYYEWFKQTGVLNDIAAMFTLSQGEKDLFMRLFPDYPEEKVALSPNGYNPGFTNEPRDRAAVLAEFTTKPYEGSPDEPVSLSTVEADHIVVWAGRFAPWKRLDGVIQAAGIYTPRLAEQGKRVATVIIGSGALDMQRRYQDLARQLNANCYFVGSQGQPELAKLFGISDVGVFPAFEEPFGLTLIECMATGTPVIGARSGGPMSYLKDEVGGLIADNNKVPATAAIWEPLADMVTQAIAENWKETKGQVAANYVQTEFSVDKQCTDMLIHVDAMTQQGGAGL
jgi:glycosyltransferase involved in cell wall biosynthesis